MFLTADGQVLINELAPRVHATCAYPGLFRAVRLGRDLYWDGGLVDKAPALAMRESAFGKIKAMAEGARYADLRWLRGVSCRGRLPDTTGQEEEGRDHDLPRPE